MALPIDYAGVTEIGNKAGDAVSTFGEEHGFPGWLTQVATMIVASLAMLGPLILATVIQGVLGLGTFFAVTVLTTIGKARTENADDFNQVIAASMSEFLGVEITSDDIPSGKGPGAMVARMRAIGDKLHDLLTTEFGGLEEITPQRGADNARAFSGYALNFAVSTAFIAILTEFETLGLIQNARELGQECAQALGLGRLQRLALQPLIRNMIQQPYDLYLKSKLRPDRLSETQYIAALSSGLLSDQQVRDALAEKGYPDSLIDILIANLTQNLALSTVARLVRYEVMTQEQAIAELVMGGLSNDRATKLLASEGESRADSQASGMLSDLETARLEGFLDQSEFSSLVDELPLSDEEDRLYRKKVADQLERPRKKLTFAQVKTGIVGGILDFDYLDTFLQNEGYTSDDQLYLTYEILLALEKTQTKEQIAQAKAARAALRLK
jgi:hypothetical protein